MKALYFDGERLRLTQDHALSRAEEAVIRVIYAGICGTDLEILRGYAGFRGVPGHEFVGVVEKSRDSELVGRTVVGEINVGCGRCRYCYAGLERHCPDRTVLGIKNRDGAFAEYINLPEKNLHLVPENVPAKVAVFVEPVAAAYEILEQIHVDPSMRVAVVGDGRLGNLTAQLLSKIVHDLCVYGKHRRKIDVLKSLGIKAIHVDEQREPHSYDIVIEASGSSSGFILASELVKPRGTIVLKTTIAGETPLNLSPLVVNEVRVVGSRCGPFKPAIKALASGMVHVGKLVDGVFSLDEHEEAFALAAEKNTLKVLLRTM
ncbi:2-deoxy-scyllo-inosamine dehydrogenase [archaeon HR01]|nr:2-deoxy-scyllo-inosamine dehydrogenase [archaeon HR01]